MKHYDSKNEKQLDGMYFILTLNNNVIHNKSIFYELFG